MSALPSIPKGFEAKSRSSKNDSKGRGSLKEKTLDCGQIVWGLAFSPWPSPPSRKLWARHHPQAPDVSCLILATGLNDGQIKIWEVQTGRSFWLVPGPGWCVFDVWSGPTDCPGLMSGHQPTSLSSPYTDLFPPGLLLLNLSGHQDVVRDLSFTPSGSLILVSASRDKTLRIWDLNKHGRGRG